VKQKFQLQTLPFTELMFVHEVQKFVDVFYRQLVHTVLSHKPAHWDWVRQWVVSYWHISTWIGHLMPYCHYKRIICKWYDGVLWHHICCNI